MAMITTPPIIITTRATNISGSGMSGSMTPTTSPISNALSTVPSPADSRRGIHSNSRAMPTMMMMTPTDHPVSSLMPVWKTSHGAAPKFASISSAIPIPNNESPATHRAMRSTGRSVGMKRFTPAR